jgi:N-acetylneuraminic acid mutarotase
VEEYEPVLDTWQQKADMPTARSTHVAVAVAGKIYVIGGLTTLGAAPLATVEAYDPTTDKWERKANIPTARGMPGASVVDGKIYVIGSFLPPSGPALATVEMYDPQTDTWTRKADMPTARGGLSCSAAQGRIYAIGGRNSSAIFATVEEYDPATDTWAKRADMGSSDPQSPTRRFSLATSMVNDRIYAIGGCLTLQVPPMSTLAVTLEYTPPRITPAARLQGNPVIKEGKSFLRLEWPSHADYRDLLQTQDQLQPNGWTDVESFSGTGETLTKDIPASEPAAFYRLQRELK